MSESDYEVGYRKPPRHSQYKKGQPSPNPNGRRGKTQEFDYGIIISDLEQALATEAERKITVQTAEGPTELSVQDLLVRKATALALGGEKNMLMFIMPALSKAQNRKTMQRLSLIGAALEYKERTSAHLEACATKGVDPGEVLPHPDDIEVDMTGVRYLGPITHAQQKVQDQVIRQRDVALDDLDSIWQNGDPANSSDRQAEVIEAELFELNARLPERLRRWPRFGDSQEGGYEGEGDPASARLQPGNTPLIEPEIGAACGAAEKHKDNSFSAAASEAYGSSLFTGCEGEIELTCEQSEAVRERDLHILQIEMSDKGAGLALESTCLELMQKIRDLNEVLPPILRRGWILACHRQGSAEELIKLRDTAVLRGGDLLKSAKTIVQKAELKMVVSELRAINKNLPMSLRGKFVPP